MNDLRIDITHAERATKGEDRAAAHTFEHAGRSYHVITVCDGHGGTRAAELAVHQLPRLLRRNVEGGAPVADAVCAAIATVADALRKEASGCALAVCVLHDDGVTCANLGDVEALLCPLSGPPIVLTTSHALHACAAERARLQAAGVQLAQATHAETGVRGGPLRAWPGGLCMARALGDADCPYVRAEPAVSCTPFMHPSVLIVATDGLWDATSRDGIVARALRRRTAASLVERAWASRTSDDVSCTVAAIGVSAERAGFLRSDSVSSLSSIDSDDDVADSGALAPRTIFRVTLPQTQP